jgi:hypothetical protein
VETKVGTMSKLVALATAIPGTTQSYMFDRLLGVSTREAIRPADSSSAMGYDNMPYTVSAWLPVRRALKRLSPGPDDVLVDLGSGKGKVLLIAGRLPYGRVIGVEIDEGLGRCAKTNIRHARSRLRAKEVNSVVVSALDWPVPDELSVVFMYNPFAGETFRKAVRRVIDSYDRTPRKLHIVYGFPLEHNWLVSTGRVAVEKVAPANWPTRPDWWRRGDIIITYRVVPPSGGTPGKRTHRRAARRDRATEHWSSPNDYRFQVGPLWQGAPKS